MGKNLFIYCEKCGKKLLERKSNGIWCFKFGKNKSNGEPIVDMEIYGSLKFKCPRRSCGHVNVLNYFPGTPFENNNLIRETPKGDCASNPEREKIN